jgi:hypothetical protein
MEFDMQNTDNRREELFRKAVKAMQDSPNKGDADALADLLAHTLPKTKEVPKCRRR